MQFDKILMKDAWYLCMVTEFIVDLFSVFLREIQDYTWRENEAILLLMITVSIQCLDSCHHALRGTVINTLH